MSFAFGKGYFDSIYTEIIKPGRGTAWLVWLQRLQTKLPLAHRRQD